MSERNDEMMGGSGEGQNVYSIYTGLLYGSRILQPVSHPHTLASKATSCSEAHLSDASLDSWLAMAGFWRGIQGSAINRPQPSTWIRVV